MSRYIDADALLNNLPDHLPYKASVKRVLIQAPTEDVVEVVRCKDCKYKIIHTCPITGTKTLFCDYGIKPVAVEASHYCGYGERREG